MEAQFEPTYFWTLKLQVLSNISCSPSASTHFFKPLGGRFLLFHGIDNSNQSSVSLYVLSSKSLSFLGMAIENLEIYLENLQTIESSLKENMVPSPLRYCLMIRSMPAHVLLVRVSAGSQVPARGSDFNTLNCLVPFAGSSATYSFPKTGSLPKKQMFLLSRYSYKYLHANLIHLKTLSSS